MPVLIAAIIGGLASAMASLVGRALLALGMAFVTYKGVNYGTDQIVAYMKSAYAGMPADALNMLGYLWVDKALSMLVSTFAAAVALKTSTGAITKLVVKQK